MRRRFRCDGWAVNILDVAALSLVALLLTCRAQAAAFEGMNITAQPMCAAVLCDFDSSRYLILLYMSYCDGLLCYFWRVATHPRSKRDVGGKSILPPVSFAPPFTDFGIRYVYETVLRISVPAASCACQRC